MNVSPGNTDPRPAPPADRPQWWPENEAWPPRSATAWRRSAGRLFVRRVVLVLAAVLFLIIAANVLVFSLPGPFKEAHGGRFGKLPGFIGLVLLVLIIIATVRYIRHLASPIGDVIEASARVARGDYSVRVTPRGAPELRGLIASFNEMAGRLETNEEQRRRLIADVAHELRTPLSVIRGNAEGVLDGLYAADDQSLGPIVVETKTMARLLDDLQTLTMAETGTLTLYRQTVDPHTLVDGVVAAFAGQAAEKRVELRTDLGAFAAGLPGLDVDPVRIRQVLENLVSNALRYTPPGGSITVGTSLEDGSVVFRVIDSGSGIRPEDLPHLFDRFTKSADSGGSGLGLAIAKTLVEAHGGEIGAQNSVTGGAVMTLRLPIPATGAKAGRA
jgi:two-component system, OmpR family, sensor histidine kinase BaeS